MTCINANMLGMYTPFLNVLKPEGDCKRRYGLIFGARFLGCWNRCPALEGHRGTTWSRLPGLGYNMSVFLILGFNKIGAYLRDKLPLKVTYYFLALFIRHLVVQCYHVLF